LRGGKDGEERRIKKKREPDALFNLVNVMVEKEIPRWKKRIQRGEGEVLTMLISVIFSFYTISIILLGDVAEKKK